MNLCNINHKVLLIFVCLVSIFPSWGQDSEPKTDIVNIEVGLQSPMPIRGMLTTFVCLGGSISTHPQQKIQLYGGIDLLGWRFQDVTKSFLEANYTVHFGKQAKKSTRRSWFFKGGLGVFMQYPYVVFGEPINIYSPYLNLAVGRDFYLVL